LIGHTDQRDIHEVRRTPRHRAISAVDMAEDVILGLIRKTALSS
jgi:hypothetical protein